MINFWVIEDELFLQEFHLGNYNRWAFDKKEYKFYGRFDDHYCLEDDMMRSRNDPRSLFGFRGWKTVY